MKLKTHKAIAKRLKIKKGSKILKKRAGQDHFNARQSGKVRRRKRRMHTASSVNVKQVKQSLPYR